MRSRASGMDDSSGQHLSPREAPHVAVIERSDGQDFPYYNGRPVGLSSSQWWFLMGVVTLAFGVLAFVPFGGLLWNFPSAILFTGLPLLGLALVAREHWTALFRPVSGFDFLLMIGFALLNIIVTLAIGAIVSLTVGVDPNPTADVVGVGTTLERVLFYPRTAIQLLGEELFTILPFLAMLTLGVSTFNLTRTQAVLSAWLISAVIFGLIHLPTYNWNIIQCVVVIGSARLVLSLAYTRTKNLWVSTGAHIINDWVLLSLPLFIAL
jgi:uncharacterized protein